MKKIQRIILAFMLGIVPIQSALADSRVIKLAFMAQNGELEKVKTLIEKEGVDINARETKYGATALMYASKKGHLEVVKYLISKGADINARGTEIGATALMFASTNGHLEVVKYLIDKGADINAKADNGGTALIFASETGHLGVVKALVEGKSGLLSMFSKGADVNAKDNNGFTALMNASGEGHLEVVKYLISKGANVNVVLSAEIKGVVHTGTALDFAKTNTIKEALKNAGAKTAKEIQK